MRDIGKERGGEGGRAGEINSPAGPQEPAAGPDGSTAQQSPAAAAAAAAAAVEEEPAAAAAGTGWEEPELSVEEMARA